MSTIIDTEQSGARWSWLRQAAAALVVWCALIIVITVAVEPTDDVIVIGPTRATLAALSNSENLIVDSGSYFIRIRGARPDFIRTLYYNGAWLVLPSSAGGCINFGKRIV
jgi:hypothetical protein